MSSFTSFTAGRPKFHVVASRGWMNDPCAPGYLTESGEFQLMYQWNPHSIDWDNISWGRVRSKDLVRWEYCEDEPVFVPDQPYDQKGIFTGCMYPKRWDGELGASIFYTSVPYLPIHWTTPHHRGAEGISLITTSDGGRTWQKDTKNPVVAAEPEHLKVTGFRDPAIMQWPAMEAIWDHKLFGIVAGGVQGEEEGPRFFLYGIDPTNMRKWTFLMTLGDLPRNHVPDTKWSGDFGTNWECGTFIHLQSSDGIQRTVGVLGLEGGKTRRHVEEYRAANPDRPKRDPRFVHWFFTDVTEKGDIKIGTTGVLDWADLYAASIFQHPDGRHIVWGWIVDQDLGRKLAEEKGWIGCLGIPREIALTSYEGVKGTLKTPVSEICGFECSGDKVLTVTTQPLQELIELRLRTVFDITDAFTGRALAGVPLTCEIKVSVEVPENGLFELNIRENAQVRTTIRFDADNEELSVIRSASSTLETICLQDEISPLTLLRFESHTEMLELHVFIDNDVIELFANGRVAIATRAYSPPNAKGLSFSCENGCKVRQITAWEIGSIGLE